MLLLVLSILNFTNFEMLANNISALFNICSLHHYLLCWALRKDCDQNGRFVTKLWSFWFRHKTNHWSISVPAVLEVLRWALKRIAIKIANYWQKCKTFDLDISNQIFRLAALPAAAAVRAWRGPLPHPGGPVRRRWAGPRQCRGGGRTGPPAGSPGPRIGWWEGGTRGTPYHHRATGLCILFIFSKISVVVFWCSNLQRAHKRCGQQNIRGR